MNAVCSLHVLSERHGKYPVQPTSALSTRPHAHINKIRHTVRDRLAKKRLLAKAKVAVILRAAAGGVRFTDKSWEHGTVYLTDEYLWVAQDGKLTKIAIDNIVFTGRKEGWVFPARMGEQILAIDHEAELEHTLTTILISAPLATIHALTDNLRVLRGATVSVEQRPEAIDEKLLTFIDAGIRRDTWGSLLGLDRFTLKDALRRLSDMGYIDDMGRLTDKGKTFLVTTIKGGMG